MYLRIFSVVMMLSLVITSMGRVYAEESTETNHKELIFKAKEITNENVLLQRARKGIVESKNKPKLDWTLKHNGRKVHPQNIKSMSTVQKLESLRINKCTKEKFKQTIFTFIPTQAYMPQDTPQQESTDITMSSIELKDTREETSGSYTVKNTNTIFYEKVECHGAYSYKINSVDSTWELQDTSFTLGEGTIKVLLSGGQVDNQCNLLGSDRIQQSKQISNVSSYQTYTYDPSINYYYGDYGSTMTQTIAQSKTIVEYYRDPDNKFTFSLINDIDG